MSGMQVKKYFEKKVSLLSTSDVRYDGELYTVDPSEQSIALKHVNCMGTEGRRSGDQAIAPSDCTYEFIIFRAVNIRELWLDEGNGHRRDLTNEILNPLRAGQNADNYPKPRQDMYDTDAPKRKVGYQSRSSQQQGYDAYYGGGYDPYYGGGGGQGYRQPPQRTYVNDQPRGGYGPPQTYYDTPNQGNYYGGQGGYPPRRGYSNRGGQYGAPPPQPSYNQRQRQRPPQYYNQQPRQPYYNQGYGQQYGYQQRRYQNRGYPRYGNQNRSYNTGRYNNQRNKRVDTRQRSNYNEQAGTGAFLDSRRLRGDEIDIKDAQDFDFGAAIMQKDDTQQNGGGPPTENIVGPIETDKSAKKEETETETTEAADNKESVEVGTEDDTKEDASKKYDKNKSFFDALPTETKKSKPKQDLQTQKDVDTKTFGSVAATYKSRHINRQRGYKNRGYNNQGNNRSQQRQGGYYQSQQRGYQNRNAQSQSQYQRQPQNVGYSTSKWVRR